MNRNEIFEAITAERARQDEKHPVAFKCLLDEHNPDIETIRRDSRRLKTWNNALEVSNNHTAFGLTNEERLEFFAETDKSRQVEEAIQNAALWLRIIEEITK